MKQKLLLIIEAMSGGAGRHVQDLISHLPQEKFDIFVIYSNHRTNPEFLEKIVTMNEQATFISCDFQKGHFAGEGDCRAKIPPCQGYLSR